MLVVPKFAVWESLWWTDVDDAVRELIGTHFEQYAAASIRKTRALVVCDIGEQLKSKNLISRHSHFDLK